MRYQKAKELTEIIPLLYSPDHETVLLGALMLKEHCVIKNLNKHYKKRIDVRWPGWSSSTPEKFNKYISTRYKDTFTKQTIDRLFEYNETSSETNYIVLLILSWLYEYCSYGKTRYKTNLVSDLFHDNDIDDHDKDRCTEHCVTASLERKERRKKHKRRSKSEINILNRYATINQSKDRGSNSETAARLWLQNYLNCSTNRLVYTR